MKKAQMAREATCSEIEKVRDENNILAHYIEKISKKDMG